MTWCIMHTYKAKGFHFAGVEAGFECWCGYVSPPKNKIAPASECNKPCRGDSDIKCGGDWRMNVFTTRGNPFIYLNYPFYINI